MKKGSMLDRRSLLKAALGAPLLKTLLPSTSFGQAAAPPKRIIFWFQPGGVCHAHYHVRPNSTATDWGYDAAGDTHTLLPLLPYKDRTIHFDSDDRVTESVKADDDWTKLTDGSKHPFGLTDMAGCLGPDPTKPPDAMGRPTRELTIGHESFASLMTGRFPTRNAGGWEARGESIDVAIGKVLGAGTRIRSVQLGVNSNGTGFGLSYQNDGQRLPTVDDPRQSFQTLFAGIPSMPGVDPARAELERKMKRRGRAMELAYARFQGLESGLAAPDRTRMQQHFDAYRDIEQRLTELPMVTSSACRSPMAPASNLNINDPLTLPARGKLMMDQAVLAMACDVSRVFTLSWTHSATNHVFSFLPGFTTMPGPNNEPSPDGHHPLSHDAYGAGFAVVTDANRAAFDKKRRIERWYAEQLAYFLGQLDSIREADGSTLLDNTVVVTLNEIYHSGAHNNSNLPVRLYGNARGAFQTGRYLMLGHTPLNSLYVSLANAVGVPMTTFGEPRFDYQFTGPFTRWQWQSKSVTTGRIASL
ncbi:MAG: DUF1552 domain-containing protein [Myxococcaceae bacterium]|nr:DUF1552 domain-containing protein [Myxococcaceae bacterium]